MFESRSSGASGGLTIRPAKRGDMPAIRRLIAAFPGELDQESLPRLPSFFVAADNDEIVGCCALQVYSPRLAEVRSLAVSRKHRGRGIAVGLVEKCRERARERGVRQLLAVSSEPEFFERLGFQVHSGWKTALFAAP